MFSIWLNLMLGVQGCQNVLFDPEVTEAVAFDSEILNKVSELCKTAGICRATFVILGRKCKSTTNHHLG
jgi:hypothetical protein